MKKLTFIVAAFSFLLGSPSVKAAEDSLTLVVGNTRQKGWVKPCVAALVGQNEADFTHTNSFPGKVVSVDLYPLSNRSSKRYKHLTVDFVNSSPQTLLSKTHNIAPNRIFFEWFPSCQFNTPGKNLTPLLLPALKNAFEILAPDGEIFIDHFAYVGHWPTDFSSAFTKLKEEKANMTHVKRALGSPSREVLQAPGYIAQQLQKADPFMLHIIEGEHEEMRKALIFKAKNNDQPFDDSACQFIKNKNINQIIDRFAQHFPALEKIQLIANISNGMLYSYQQVKEEQQGYWDLFEQHYYMETRKTLIKQSLEGIGFRADTIAIQSFDINPYNQRKHAWIITAKK